MGRASIYHPPKYYKSSTFPPSKTLLERSITGIDDPLEHGFRVGKLLSGHFFLCSAPYIREICTLGLQEIQKSKVE